MLYLIKGRAGSGKTQKLRETAKDILEKNLSKPVFLIPRQFSFETERSLLKLLGPKKLKNVDIFSFSRLAYNVLKDTEYFSKKVPDDGVRLALMSESLNELNGRLNIFDKLKTNSNSLSPLVNTCNEFKRCGIDSQALSSFALTLKDGFLKDKLQEISLISIAYDSLIKQSYFDDTDALEVLTKYIAENNYFKGKTLFIDGFRNFSAQELNCLGVMMSQADNVYITLCVDGNPKKFTSLYFVSKIEKILRTVANDYNIKVEEILCKQNEDAFKNNIFAIEKNIFSDGELVQTNSDESVVVTQCVNIDDECKYVAKTIKKLLRDKNYRCKEIAIIERSEGVYKNKLIDELNNLSIPVFVDSRHSLIYEPLFIYVSAVLSCIGNGFTTENILTILKTGFTSLNLTQISKLEKYAFVWGLNGSAWLKDFTMHPDGFGKKINENTQKQIDELNKFRKDAVLPIYQLKKECTGKTFKEITENLYNYLITQKVDDRLFELYTNLNNDGFPVEAQRQEASWDILINILDSIVNLCGEKNYSLSRYNEIFNIFAEAGEFGEIPQGLDQVTIGSADRIRTDRIKVVFLVGVNKDEFPLVSVKNGILTDSDRLLLNENGLEVNPPYEATVDEERFISYCAVTAATEKLYMTFRTNNDDGSLTFKSEIVDVALNSIIDLKINDYRNFDVLDKIENEDNAFTYLCQNYNNRSTLKTTLLKFFENKENYKDKITALNNISEKKNIEFNDKDISKKLFGEEMYISASKVENFYKCPFAYFVRYGLYAEPLKTAELNPAQNGTIIHYIMENILQDYPGESFITADYNTLRASVESIVNKYLNEKMGGISDKSQRFLFLFNRLIDISMTVIERLRQEFKDCNFIPHDFELGIGGEKIPAYELPLDDGKLIVKGSIDRVDIMEKDGIKYVRVVDYKTGVKNFKLCELLDGLNIQMVLYLMAIEKNGTDYYGDTVPAGVLYLPSRIGMSNYLKERNPDKADVIAQKRNSGKMSGMILGSPVVFNGMGIDKYPDIFPASYNAKNDFKGNYYSLKSFNNLSRTIDNELINMGNSLHEGKIAPVPCGNDGVGNMCVYCDYKAICGFEYGDEIRELGSLSHNKVIQKLEAEEDE